VIHLADTSGKEEGSGKEKKVGEEELSSPTRSVSLEAGPRARLGRDFRDGSCTLKETASPGGRGKTSPRKAWSSRRKEKASEGFSAPGRTKGK
jgi:hypothetical protein